nr:hypothetical protein [Pedobacter sp. ASV19]
MKKYLYHGNSILSFSHEGQDYLAQGAGPHDLPEDAVQVQSLIGLSKLVEQIDQVKKPEVKPTNN